MGPQLFVIAVAQFRLKDSGQRTFAAGEIQYDAFKLVRLFIDQPKSGEVVAKISPDGCRCRPEQFVNVQLRNDVIVDLQQQPESIPFFHYLSLVKLCVVPRQRALERDRNMRRQRTEKFDIFGDKFLSPFLCHDEKSVSLLGGRNWKHISASSDRLSCKWSHSGCRNISCDTSGRKTGFCSSSARATAPMSEILVPILIAGASASRSKSRHADSLRQRPGRRGGLHEGHKCWTERRAGCAGQL